MSMDEILALQKQLAAVQMADSAHRISERNAVEIILKLIESKKVELIFTASGKEYLTPKQLRNEVMDEVLAANGRISLVELSGNLGVDMSHVERTVAAILKEDRSIMLLTGQLIADYYFDSIIDEISELLHDSGQLPLTSQSSKYALPVDLLQEEIERRLGTSAALTGCSIRNGELYTPAFVTRHNARVRGAFAGLTRPTPLRSVLQSGQFQDSLAIAEVQRLIDARSLPGTIQGSATPARATYQPLGFTKSQDAGIASFYELNGYIEYDKLKRMQMGDPKTYLRKTFPAGIELDSCWLSADMYHTVSAAIEDAIEAGRWIHATPLLPSPLSRADVAAVVKRAIERKGAAAASAADSKDVKQSKSGKDKKSASSGGGASAVPALAALQMGQVYAVSDAFVLGCTEALKPFVKETVMFHAQKLQKKKGGSKEKEDDKPAKAKATAADDDGDDDDDADGGEDDDADEAAKPAKATKKSPALAAAAAKKSKKAAPAAGSDEDEGDDGAGEVLSGPKARKLKRQAKAAKATGKAPPALLSRQSSTGSTKSTASGSSSKASKASAAAAAPAVTPETALTIDVLSTELKKKWPNSSDGESGSPAPELVQSVARHIRPSLIEYWNSIQLSVVTGGASDRRAFVDRITTTLQQLYEHMQIFHEASQSLLADGESAASAPSKSRGGKSASKGSTDSKSKKPAAAAASASASASASGAAVAGGDEKDGGDGGDGDAAGGTVVFVRSLQKYLLKTLANQSADLLLRSAGLAHDFDFNAEWMEAAGKEMAAAAGPAAAANSSSGDASAAGGATEVLLRPLTPKERSDILKHVPSGIAKPLQSLLSTLSLDTSAEFITAIVDAADGVDIRLKPNDKKKERNLIFNVRRGIMSALPAESNPSAVLHSALTVVHSQATGVLLHVPSRNIPSLLQILKQSGALTDEAITALSQYSTLCTRYTAALKGGAAAPAAPPAVVEGEAAAVDPYASLVSAAELRAKLDELLPAIREYGVNPKSALA